MTDHRIEPEPIARLVDEYVDHELRAAAEYSNRTPLDESGVFSLHRLAAAIYAAAWEDAERSAFIRASRERQRGVTE